MAVSVFEFEDYRKFLRAYLETLPKGGHGQLRQIARKINIHTTYISQVLSGLKNFSADQAIELSEYLKLTALETKYFLLLVDLERAGSFKLKDFIRSQLFQVREDSQKLTTRLNKEKILSEKAQSTFYSQWLYSAVRIASSLPEFQHRRELAKYFHLDHNELEKIIDFLVKNDLCEQQGEKVIMGPQRTHLPDDSPFISKHHINWRLRAFENYNRKKKEDLSFTGPLSIAKKDAIVIREKLAALIQELSETVKNSEAEALYCLNLDWFGF
jgi:uncharacterized protein (TIGR02147 family)